MDEMTGYKCKCGHCFQVALGPMGCPNCCGDRGPAIRERDPVDTIRALMQRHGLTSRQVAALVGVHPVTVRRWMTGKARVPQSALMVLDGLEKC